MPELSTVLLAVAATAAAGLTAFLTWRKVRRRREARDLERAYVERHPLALTAAEVDRALDPSPEPDPPSPGQPAGQRLFTLGGATVAAAVAALLLIARPDGPLTPDGTGDSEPASPATQLTRLPIQHQPPPSSEPSVPRSTDGPAAPPQSTSSARAPAATSESAPSTHAPTTTSPTPPETDTTTTTEDEADTTTTTSTTTTTTTEEAEEGEEAEEKVDEPDGESTDTRATTPAAAGSDGDASALDQPTGHDAGTRPEPAVRGSLVLTLVDTVAELVDPRR